MKIPVDFVSGGGNLQTWLSYLFLYNICQDIKGYGLMIQTIRSTCSLMKIAALPLMCKFACVYTWCLLCFWI